MRRKRDPIPRAKDSWVWLGGIALLGILGAGVVAAAVVLWENIDIRQLVPELAAAPEPLPVPEPPRPPAFDSVTFDAFLLDSDRNRAYFPDSTYYDAALSTWHELLVKSGGRVTEVTGAAGLRALDPEDVLVVVEAPCLSTAEIAAIRAHMRRGGGLVANWAVGARDTDCEWTGWDVVRELTGAEDVREIPPREALFLTVPSGTALSAGVDPGTRIELRPDPSLALWLEGPRVYWSDWALNPAPDESGGGADVAASAYRAPSGARVAWFGLRANQAWTPLDSARLAHVLQNGILWAAGVPSAQPAPWPEGHNAAAVFALDVEAEAENALHMADLLRETGIPGSFFAVSQLVSDDAKLGEALAAVGEVGSQTADHMPVAGLTTQDQGVRLRRSWQEIESWTGRAPAGLRPPEERFDSATLAAWHRVGGTYLLASNEARSASPELYDVGGGSVVLLPRVLKDDYNIIVQDRVLRGASLGDAYLAGLNKMHAIGGLAVVSGHTQILREGPRLAALRRVAGVAVGQGDWWIASADTVASWWLARDQVRISFARDADARPDTSLPSLLVVDGPPDADLEGLWVDFVLPSGTSGLLPLVDGRPVDFVTSTWGMRVPVGVLPAGESRTISFLPLDGTPDR